MLFRAKMKVSHYHDHNLCSIWFYSHSYTEGRSKNCGFVWKRRTCSLLAISRWKARRRISLAQDLKGALHLQLIGWEWIKEPPENEWLCLKNEHGTSGEWISSKDCFQPGWPMANRTWKYRGVYVFFDFFFFCGGIWGVFVVCKTF